MKRSQIVFVTFVFTALLTGFLVEHADMDDPFRVQFAAPSEITLDPVELPRGQETLVGEVLTVDGEPAPDVTVFLYAEEARPGSAEPVHWTMSDAAGRFQIGELLPQTYQASLILPEHPIATRTVSLPTAGEVSWTLAETLPPIEVLPELRRAELVGRILPSLGLENPTLAPEGYEVVLLPARSAHPLSGAVVRRTLTAPDGTFRLEKLVAEDYLIHVLPSWSQGGAWPVLGAVYHRHEPEPPPDARLDLRLRSGEVTGTLVDPDGKPIQGALIKLWEAGDSSKIWPPATTDAQGLFLIDDLPESRYRLRVRSGNDAKELGVSVLIGQRIVVPRITLDPIGEKP